MRWLEGGVKGQNPSVAELGCGSDNLTSILQGDQTGRSSIEWSSTTRFAPFLLPTTSSCSIAPLERSQPSSRMSGADSPEILAAYDAVRSDKDGTNWLIISYASAVGDALKLTATGTGGLEELATKLDASQAQYAYVRVEYANDTESKRVKFVLVIWIGEGTKVMRKARVSIESGVVKKVLGHHSIQVDARDKGDLEEKDIVVRLRKAGGADYNGGRG